MCDCMNGMKRKKRMNGLNTGGFVSTLTNEALPAAVGYLLADLATKNLSFLSTNPTLGNGIKIAGGLLIAAQGGMMSGVGVGFAANGVVSFAKPVFKLSGVGLLPPGVPSRYLAGTPTLRQSESDVMKF